VLLEIFDSFRQSVEPYDEKWKKEHLWLNLAHVCRNWRAVMFASITRLDLGITVGPEKPGHIKTVLSARDPSLPIFLDYSCIYDWEEDITGITGSALWRMRAVLKHHRDRVRGIKFDAEHWASFNKFFKMTNCVFPMLESLSLCFIPHDPNIPATFLKGPDLSCLPHLRRLTVKCITFPCIFDFLMSATGLTDLTLAIDAFWGPTPETSLFACLQAMPCLLSLDVTLLARPVDPLETMSPEAIDIAEHPEFIVTHPKLKRVYITGDRRVITLFVRWFRTPSLEHLTVHHIPPHMHHSPFNNYDTEERFDTALLE